jgi:hypothetical protein
VKPFPFQPLVPAKRYIDYFIRFVMEKTPLRYATHVVETRRKRAGHGVSFWTGPILQLDLEGAEFAGPIPLPEE